MLACAIFSTLISLPAAAQIYKASGPPVAQQKKPHTVTKVGLASMQEISEAVKKVTPEWNVLPGFTLSANRNYIPGSGHVTFFECLGVLGARDTVWMYDYLSLVPSLDITVTQSIASHRCLVVVNGHSSGKCQFKFENLIESGTIPLKKGDFHVFFHVKLDKYNYVSIVLQRTGPGGPDGDVDISSIQIFPLKTIKN